jgi:hypothetical protein
VGLAPSPEEPPAGPWRVEPLAHVARTLLGAPDPSRGRPRIVAVDGRSGGGKTTFAIRLAAEVPASAVVHTDDVAWHHARFDWAALLVAGVLDPVRRGESVAFRPPAWEARSRPGAVEVEGGLDLVIVEGVGAGRAQTATLMDAIVWVQSDAAAARERGIERDGGDEAARRHWDEWASEEDPFLARDRPWERAGVVVAGTPVLPHDPETEVVVAPAFERWS